MAFAHSKPSRRSRAFSPGFNWLRIRVLWLIRLSELQLHFADLLDLISNIRYSRSCFANRAIRYRQLCYVCVL